MIEKTNPERWLEVQGFPYFKTKDGTYFWQTSVASCELTPQGEMIWHRKDFFEKILKSRLTIQAKRAIIESTKAKEKEKC